MILGNDDETNAIGGEIGRAMRVGDVVTLSGPLGAGKTTMARGMIEALGLVGEVQSPTFPLVIAYESRDLRMNVAHIDLYRVKDPAEIDELGLDEMREDGALIVEWPEHGPAFDGALALTLVVNGDGTRRLTATVPPRWEGRWPHR